MFLRPWTPAENEPAEPKALTQSLQLICSLMPSSTVPSTRLVIIWLKRCLATSLMELALESAPVGQGGNAAAAGGRSPEVSSAAALRRLRVGLEVDVGVDAEVDVDVDVELDVDVEHEVGADCAQATPDSPRRKSSAAATSMVAKTIQLREKPAMVTSRTGCRWDLRSSPA